MITRWFPVGRYCISLWSGNQPCAGEAGSGEEALFRRSFYKVIDASSEGRWLQRTNAGATSSK